MVAARSGRRPLQWIFDALPLSYAVEAMRELTSTSISPAPCSATPG
jgi:hypothetical protein